MADQTEIQQKLVAMAAQALVHRDPDVGQEYDEDGQKISVHAGWDIAFGCRVNFTLDSDGKHLASVQLSDQALRDGGCIRPVTRQQIREFAHDLIEMTEEMGEFASVVPFLTAAQDAVRDAVDRDLVHRLAAADQAWSAEFGDERSSPDYIRYLAEHVTALRETTAPAVREPRVWRKGDPEPDETVRALALPKGSYWAYLVRGGHEGWYFSTHLDPEDPIALGSSWDWASWKTEGPLTEVVPVSTPGGES